MSAPSHPKGAARGAYTVEIAAEAKLPKRAKQAVIYFADEHGRLTRNNPNQTEMNLKTVPSAPAEGPLKTVTVPAVANQ